MANQDIHSRNTELSIPEWFGFDWCIGSVWAQLNQYHTLQDYRQKRFVVIKSKDNDYFLLMGGHFDMMDNH